MIAFLLALIAAIIVAKRAHRARVHERGRARLARSWAISVPFVLVALLVSSGDWVTEWFLDTWRDLNGQSFYDWDYLWYFELIVVTGAMISLLCAQYATIRWDWRFGLGVLAILIGGMIVHPMYTVGFVHKSPIIGAIAAYASPPILPLLTVVLSLRIGRQNPRSTTCLICGYDLSGHVGSLPCPECGTDLETATFVRGTPWRMDLPALVRGAIGWIGVVALLWPSPLLARSLVEMSYGNKAFTDSQAAQLALQYELNSNTTSQLIWPCVLVAVALPTAVQCRVTKWWAAAMACALIGTIVWWILL